VVIALPSSAYIDIWDTLHRPAVRALEAVLNDYGTSSAARARAPLTPDESASVARAGIVALTAAFQAYVVALFEVTVQAMTSNAATVARLRKTHIEGTDAAHRRFGNPRPEAVRALFNALFDVLLPNADIWQGVTVGAHTWQGALRTQLSEQQTQDLVGAHVTLRNGIAHGEVLSPVTLRDLSERVAVFDQIVEALDNSARGLIARYRGTAPW